MRLTRHLLTQLLLCFSVFGHSVFGQTAQTTAFTYQGILQASGSPANGNFDFEFRLFNLISGGTQQGTTNPRNVVVTNGVFTVTLDFGAPALSGADRFLDIAVRAPGAGEFTPLAPRQQLSSSPYSVRSLSSTTADVATNASQLGGVPANQYVTTSNGSTNFIQNTTTQQTGNFNINGNGVIGGNLGINTPAPSQRLHVVGNGLINGNLTVTGVLSANLSQNCPSGYVLVGPKLCAEFNDSSGFTFTGASARCIAAGGHLMTSGEVRTILKTGVVLGTGGVVLDWLADQTGDDVALYVNNGADAENPEGVRATSTVSYARCMINLP